MQSQKQYSICNYIWDDKLKKYEKLNDKEVKSCCTNTCKPFIDTCMKECIKTEEIYRNDCYNTCNDIKKMCDIECNVKSYDKQLLYEYKYKKRSETKLYTLLLPLIIILVVFCFILYFK